MNDNTAKDYLKKVTRSIPDYPKKGIIFRDLTTIFQDGEAFSLAMDLLVDALKGAGANTIEFDKWVGIEARGFLLSGALAGRLGGGVVLMRKAGKLPHETKRIEYKLEYGEDALEVHKDSINPGDKVIVVDDLLATGGTAEAGCKLVEELGGKVVKVLFLVELPELKGRLRLSSYDVESIIRFEGH
jgi:adenine phosphoribosyltransferase